MQRLYGAAGGPPGCEGGPGGFPGAGGFPVMLLVVFLVPRKVPAGSCRLVYIFQSFGSSTSPPYYERENNDVFLFYVAMQSIPIYLFYFYKLSEWIV